MRNGGYTLVVAPTDYPGKLYRGRYCYEHHLVWWQNTGETIGDDEVVHHRDEVKTNNAFSNLERKTVAKHVSEHRPSPDVWEIECFECHQVYEMLAYDFRERAKAYGHTNFCCSRSCQVRKQQKERKLHSS